MSVWCALDAATEDNGTIYVLPYSRAGTRELVEHVREPGSHDKVAIPGTNTISKMSNICAMTKGNTPR